LAAEYRVQGEGIFLGDSMIQDFWKSHFDHLLLALLGIIGAVAGLWASSHNQKEAASWLFTQSAGALAALLMRMQPHKDSGADPNPKP
jgi:uncharacterized membrane protein YfcA